MGRRGEWNGHSLMKIPSSGDEDVFVGWMKIPSMADEDAFVRKLFRYRLPRFMFHVTGYANGILLGGVKTHSQSSHDKFQNSFL